MRTGPAQQQQQTEWNNNNQRNNGPGNNGPMDWHHRGIDQGRQDHQPFNWNGVQVNPMPGGQRSGLGILVHGDVDSAVTVDIAPMRRVTDVIGGPPARS